MTAPTISVRIAFADDPFAAAPTWTDVSGLLVSYSFSRGRQHELGRMEAGTATVVLQNAAGDFWPNNVAGAYYPDVHSRKKIDIRVTYGGVTYPRFTGFIEDWAPGFISEPMLGDVMTLTCSDLFRYLAGFPLNGAGYAEELSGTRIDNVLTALGWPAGDRDLDAGQSNMEATGALANVNGLDHIYDVAASERGLFFQSAAGIAVFQDRHARFSSPLDTSQATFAQTTGVGELPYKDIALEYGEQHVYSEVRAKRAAAGAVEQVATDTRSPLPYGPRSLVLSDLLVTSDNEALAQAQYLLGQYKDQAMRARSIVIEYPEAYADDLYPAVMGREISDRITVKFTRASIDAPYHIEGVSESWSLDAPDKIVTAFQLSNADSQAYWALGTAGLSELGETTKLAY